MNIAGPSPPFHGVVIEQLRDWHKFSDSQAAICDMQFSSMAAASISVDAPLLCRLLLTIKHPW